MGLVPVCLGGGEGFFRIGVVVVVWDGGEGERGGQGVDELGERVVDAPRASGLPGRCGHGLPAAKWIGDSQLVGGVSSGFYVFVRRGRWIVDERGQERCGLGMGNWALVQAGLMSDCRLSDRVAVMENQSRPSSCWSFVTLPRNNGVCRVWVV